MCEELREGGEVVEGRGVVCGAAGALADFSGDKLSLASNSDNKEVCFVGGKGGGTCDEDAGGRKSVGVERNRPMSPGLGQGGREGVVVGSWEGVVVGSWEGAVREECEGEVGFNKVWEGCSLEVGGG